MLHVAISAMDVDQLEDGVILGPDGALGSDGVGCAVLDSGVSRMAAS